MFGTYPFARTPLDGLPYNIFTGSVTENISVTEYYLAGKVFTDSVSENAVLADTPTTSAQFVSSITENYSVEDTRIVGSAYTISFSENSTLSDSPIGNVHYPISQSENQILSDIIFIQAGFSGIISENVAPADSSSQITTYNVNRTEGLLLADTPTVIAGFASSIIENSDISSIEIVSAQFAQSLAENFHPEWYSIEGEAYYASLVENFTSADSSVVNINYVVSKVDGFVINDIPSITAQFQSSRTEAFVVSDSIPAITHYLISVNENTGETAYASAIAGFAAQQVEAVEVKDLISYFHYPVSVGWSPIDTDIYNYSGNTLMLGAASFSQIPFSGNTGGESIVTPNWTLGSNCAYETVPVYTYIPINPQGAIFGGGTFGAFTFGGFSGLYDVITTYERIGPTNTNVVWADINNETYTTVGTTVAVFGGVPISAVAISSSVGGTVIVTPNWKDIINS